MKHTVNQVFVGQVRLLAVDGHGSGILKAPAEGPLLLGPGEDCLLAGQQCCPGTTCQLLGPNLVSCKP